MKKVGILLFALSMVSFSARTTTRKATATKKATTKSAQALTVVDKFNQLETQYAALVNRENNEFAKIRANAENAAKQLEERTALRAQIQEKIEKIESAANSKVFKEQYSNVVKEYKNVVKALDTEIKRLTTTVENYQALEQLKGE